MEEMGLENLAGEISAAYERLAATRRLSLIHI